MTEEIIVFDGTVYFFPDELHRRMMARIAELESEKQIVLNELGELRGALVAYPAQIWEPLTDSEIVDESHGDTRRLIIDDECSIIRAELKTRMGGYSSVTVSLPPNVRICKLTEPTT